MAFFRTAELIFEDCHIPAANLLGAEGRGFHALMHNFQNERLVMGAMAMGEAQAAIDLTLDWTKERHAFGSPLWSKQTIVSAWQCLPLRLKLAGVLLSTRPG